ncbi:MAG: MFS transporter [Sporichthyaceae bacterium]|nr:MFS transporter [Sporichthyaceae bacterium]
MDSKTIHDRRWGILGVLVVSLLVVVLDNTVLNVALKRIQEDLGASQSQLAWAVNSYTLVFAGLLFTWGLLGDRFGRRRMLMAGLLMFGAASALSAYAHTPLQLIGARGLMGIGGAAVLPATLAIITNVFEPKERGKAIGIWAGAVGLAIVIGPVTGGLLLEHFWWGSVFLINVPIVLLGLVLINTIVPESKDPNPGKLDPLGVVIAMAGLMLVVYAIIKGGELATVANTQVLVTGLLGVALLVLFVWYERRSDHPALDVKLFTNRIFSASAVTIGLAFFAMMGVTFFMVFYLQIVRGFSPLQAGLWFLPFAGAQMVFAPLSASMVKRFGIRSVATVGLALVTVSFAGYQLVDTDSPMWVLGLVFFIQGVGMANIMPPATTAIMASLPPQRAGVGSAVNNTVRQVSGALGVAILGSVLSVQYRDEITPHLAGLPDAAREAAGESIGATVGVAAQAGPEALAQIQPAAFHAFVNAMHVTAAFSTAVALLATVLVFRFLPKQAEAPVHSAGIPAPREAVETPVPA